MDRMLKSRELRSGDQGGHFFFGNKLWHIALNCLSVRQANILFTFNNLAMSVGDFPHLHNSTIAILVLKFLVIIWKRVKIDI